MGVACQARHETNMDGTVAICRENPSLCAFSLSLHLSSRDGRQAEAQQLFVCQHGHKMVYKGSTSTTNGMNKMIYLVCASRIFDMLGYV